MIRDLYEENVCYDEGESGGVIIEDKTEDDVVGGEMTFDEAIDILDNLDTHEGDEEWDDAFSDALALTSTRCHCVDLWSSTQRNGEAEEKTVKRMIALAQTEDVIETIKYGYSDDIKRYNLEETLADRLKEIKKN